MNYKEKISDARKRLLDGIGVPEPQPFIPDEFQMSAISSVVEGVDTLVVAPTGAGKTFIAIEAIKAELLNRQRAVYTTPLKALSNTKFTEFKKLFEPTFKAGLLTGDRKIDGDADVVVATTEIYRNELYRSNDRYALVILDEVHFIADEQRGPVWEEAIILTPKHTTLLMLSASISNAEEIACWIEEVRGKPCRIVSKKVRPVELRHAFLHPDKGVIPLETPQGTIMPEVKEYYGTASLDQTGMKIKRERGAGGFSRGGRGGGGGGFRGPRDNRGGGGRGHRFGGPRRGERK